MDNSMLEIGSCGIISHRAVMDAVPDLIFVLDRSGTILEANGNACKMLSYEHNELVNRKFGSFIAGDLLTNWGSLSARGIHNKDAGVRSLLWTRNSELLLVNVWINPQFNEQGECLALLVVARTISDKNSKWDAYISRIIEGLGATRKKKENTQSYYGKFTATERMEKMKQIMIADDEEIIRKIFLDIVTMNFPNVSIDAVESGEEALKKAQKRQYDLVFLDIKMGDIDGIETYRRMRDRNPKQKVIIVTGYFDEEKNRIAMLDGICGIIYKPFTIEQILDAIQKYVFSMPITRDA